MTFSLLLSILGAFSLALLVMRLLAKLEGKYYG